MKKYYVVLKGRKKGIYDNWDNCKEQINNFPNALFKSFETLESAKIAFHGRYNFIDDDNRSNVTHKVLVQPLNPLLEGLNFLCVDAACSHNPGIMEYRILSLPLKIVQFHSPKYEDGTNNIGEFLALVHALAIHSKEELIYTDSITAISWIKNKKSNSTLTKTYKNKILFELVSRAEEWLINNNTNKKILKWQTKLWGEIPADFNRK